MGNLFSLSNLLQSLRTMVNDEAETDSETRPTSAQLAQQNEIENAVLVLVSAVIRTGDQFSPGAERCVSDFFDRQFGTGRRAYRIRTIRNYLDSGTEPYTRISCKQLAMLTTYGSRVSITKFLFTAASSDGFLTAKEVRCIHRMSGYLGISDPDFAGLRDAALKIHSPYAILDLEEDATDDMVRKAYRKCALRFHPDKREAHVSEVDATARFREIRQAYLLIREMRSNRSSGNA